MPELSLVIPVYNEEGAIRQVLDKWSKELTHLQIDYRIHVYNDGSRDKTLQILKTAEAQDSRVVVHDKKNSGHGPTILLGYRENVNADWIFQIDSDDEMGPESFTKLWNQRKNHDFLIGRRDGRYSPPSRQIVSLVSRWVVRVFYGSGIWDVNAPYRLMRSECFRDTFQRIPEQTFAPNVIISGLTCRMRLRIFETPVGHQPRNTGEVSIKKLKLLKAAAKSFGQTVRFAFH